MDVRVNNASAADADANGNGWGLLLGRGGGCRAGGRRILARLLDFHLVGCCGRAPRGTDLFLVRDRGRLAAAHKSQRQRQKAGASQSGDDLFHGLPLSCWVQRPATSPEVHARSPLVMRIHARIIPAVRQLCEDLMRHYNNISGPACSRPQRRGRLAMRITGQGNARSKRTGSAILMEARTRPSPSRVPRG